MKRLKISTLFVTIFLLSGLMTQQASAQVAHRVTVATSGGDYTSIIAALAAISPSAADPFVIDVMPGTYTETPVTMKSYVHLRGAGREVTTLVGTIGLGGVSNVSITGLTVTTSDFFGIFIDSFQAVSNIHIANNKITANRAISVGSGGASVEIEGNIITGNLYGIDIPNSSASPNIRGNTIQNNPFTTAGISMTGNASRMVSGNKITGGSHGIIFGSPGIISGNTISGASVAGIYGGLAPGDSSMTIIGNTITGNGNGGHAGLVISGGSPIILHNRITGNTPHDIKVTGSTSTPNISSNIYDTITGTTGVGLYNVKSNGTPATDP